MFRFLIGLFLILHGLVHLWLFTLSQRLVEFKPEMGWSGKSWLFTGLFGDSTTRLLASILFVVAAVAFVLSGVTIFFRSDWWWSLLLGASIVSAVTLLLFWDGSVALIVQKGLIGFLISLVIFMFLLLARRPAFAW
jgi:hypothetical protein